MCLAIFFKSVQLDFCWCDALIAFNLDQRVDGYTLKQAAKSEWDKFSKQRPKYVA